MNIKEFISHYTNHPVLFIGTGISLRYLKSSYTWDGLLSKISFDLKENHEFYLDIKSLYQEHGRYKFEKIASHLEREFNKQLIEDRYGRFKEVNDLFYEKMATGVNLSRFKIYISMLLQSTEQKEEALEEISELKKIRKNIGSIITTNYDTFIEGTFEFSPLVGNDILLSNPYGSAYKIHGCITDPSKTIITSEDYQQFKEKYELIRAQLLSLFIHNPIIFMGYNIGDENIKEILKTIFTYVEPNSEMAKKIRKNFLLVEYEAASQSEDITEHDIDMEGFATITINKIRTDNYKAIYTALSELQLPISAMDVRKVQGVVKEIYSGGSIKVSITEDLDSLKNGDKIIAIGSPKTINYQFQTVSETLNNYFKIIDESNVQQLAFIDKYIIQSSQYFPIYGFDTVNNKIEKAEKLKKQQKEKLQTALNSIHPSCKQSHHAIQQISEDDSIPESSKENAIFWGILNGSLDLSEVEKYLREYPQKEHSNYKKLLSAFDYKKYASDHEQTLILET